MNVLSEFVNFRDSLLAWSNTIRMLFPQKDNEQLVFNKPCPLDLILVAVF